MKRNIELSPPQLRILADRLNDLLSRRGMSLRELARESGVGVTTVTEIGRGKREPSLGVMVALMEALGLHSIEELFGSFGSGALLSEAQESRSGGSAA